ncbi:unnamed protein product [Paramecium pentaurelia]|uniref:Uncharacterized protein n=1 Tax=Paramecium pentaurelia TaxID=43138 RepID=A0A8S1SC42_9CILI|nr:unnamed protein product [Paramecium pentaurelia]
MNFQKQIFLIFTTVLLYLAYNNDQGFEINSKIGVLASMIFIGIIGSFKPSDPFQYEAIFRIQLWLSITFIVILVFFSILKLERWQFKQFKLMILGDNRLCKPVTKDMHTNDDNLDHYY